MRVQVDLMVWLPARDAISAENRRSERRAVFPRFEKPVPTSISLLSSINQPTCLLLSLLSPSRAPRVSPLSVSALGFVRSSCSCYLVRSVADDRPLVAISPRRGPKGCLVRHQGGWLQTHRLYVSPTSCVRYESLLTSSTAGSL
jgi:hypothetical protein